MGNTSDKVYSNTIPDNIYTAPNGIYGDVKPGICDYLTTYNSKQWPEQRQYEIKDKYIIERNFDTGTHHTYNRETGQLNTWTW